MLLIACSVADFYHQLMRMLESLGIRVTINTHPVEADNQIPFDQDTTHAEYEPLFVNRCWRILVGDDAQRLDERVRQTPELAYTPEFYQSFAAEVGWRLG